MKRKQNGGLIVKKTNVLILLLIILLAAYGAEAGEHPRQARAGSSPLLAAYPGVKINPDFNVFAERVAKINAGNIAGGNIMSMGMSDDTADKMNDMFADFDIDEYIQTMKDAGMDEETLKTVRESMENVKRQAQEGSLGNSMKEGVDMSGMGNLVNYPLNNLLPSQAMEGYDPDDWDATGEWALSIAGDMATATAFGCVTPGLMNAAGLAVSVYPHPLLLNNYAGALRSESPKDALFFYQAALEFEPQNPLLLTNIGFTYLDMGDYDTAKEYALLALQYNPESGGAYQILTRCHQGWQQRAGSRDPI
jgi:hypothetical protein